MNTGFAPKLLVACAWTPDSWMKSWMKSCRHNEWMKSCRHRFLDVGSQCKLAELSGIITNKTNCSWNCWLVKVICSFLKCLFFSSGLSTELIESVMYLYRATKDPYFLEVGRDMLESIEASARTPCGYATVS